ncbi:ubiquitin-specific protease doa4 [Phlyctochytrium planicorne]|nr:ubiquitin-specific protease doa4 [Phlyctochytrium planicorne]
MGHSSPVEAADLISRSDLGDVSIGLVGLRNLGNTCFMNSTLQCLSSTVPFSRYFLGGYYRRHINKMNPLGSKGVITDQFSQLIKSMWDGQENVVIPSQFKERISEFNSQFRGTEQHDSQEFLAYLLDAIHEDMNLAYVPNRKAVKEEEYDDERIPEQVHEANAWAAYKSMNWSIVVDLFQGQLKSRLQCMTCGKTSTTYNPFMYLSVPIPERNSAGKKGGPVYLSDCLAKFSEPEILDGDDAWHCPRCKTRRRTKKTLTVSRLPVVLIVHLKRFYFEGPFKDKLETYVDFPIEGLDLSTVLAPGSTAMAEQTPYDLYSISVSCISLTRLSNLPEKNHMGTLTQGHYTAQVYSGHKKQWYLFDDTRITVSSKDSLKVVSFISITLIFV